MFGFTRQAYYQLQKYEYASRAQLEIVLEMAVNEREGLPGIGGRKLLNIIGDSLKKENIHIGRDAFFDLLRDNRLLIRPGKTRIITTNSRHRYRRYPNLIRDLLIEKSHQLWVSDITYIPTSEGYMYLSLVTDAYSRKIVGWSLSNRLDAESAVYALNMAISQLPADKEINLVHHSDRGIQYCCDKYIQQLKAFGIRISMTENGDPLENAIAERINGTLKTEWLSRFEPVTRRNTALMLAEVIKAYNTRRPHLSIGMLTPEMAHVTEGELPRYWKNYWKLKKPEESTNE